jgi:uncharacterized RDD family membrane protein YckC
LDKKPEEYALEYAGFWIRLASGVIDFIVLIFLFYLVYTSIKAFIPHEPFRSILIILIFASWFIEIMYVTGFWVWRGQTPGKMAMGIKVIRTDSSPITIPHAFLRYLGYIVCTLTICIGFIWIAFDDRKQGLHDKMADTYVVKLPVRQVALSESLAGGEVG